MRLRRAKEPVRVVRIETETITLEALLKLSGAVSTGGEAKLRIANGEVRLNGNVGLQRGRKLRNGDRVVLDGTAYLVRGAGL